MFLSESEYNQTCTMYSFNVLLTTTGRDTLPRMLDSLLPQLTQNDYLTICIDGNHAYVLEQVRQRKFKCEVVIHGNAEPLGFWGHGSRNEYQNNLQGDFILHADDDDRYTDDAFKLIRETCIDKNTLYLFRFVSPSGVIWHTQGQVTIGNIGTPSGAIPNTHYFPLWGLYYCGDGEFYTKVSATMPYEFVDKIIYKCKNVE